MPENSNSQEFVKVIINEVQRRLAEKSSSLAGLRKGIVVRILPLSAASFLIENRRIKMR